MWILKVNIFHFHTHILCHKTCIELLPVRRLNRTPATLCVCIDDKHNRQSRYFIIFQFPLNFLRTFCIHIYTTTNKDIQSFPLAAQYLLVGSTRGSKRTTNKLTKCKFCCFRVVNKTATTTTTQRNKAMFVTCFVCENNFEKLSNFREFFFIIFFFPNVHSTILV